MNPSPLLFVCQIPIRTAVWSCLFAALIILAGCGSKSKKASGGATDDPTLKNDGTLGQWEGTFSSQGLSLSGMLMNPVSAKLNLHTDQRFRFEFAGQSNKYAEGTYALFSDEATFKVSQSTYSDFVDGPGIVIAKYEINTANQLILRFGEKQIYYFQRPGTEKSDGSAAGGGSGQPKSNSVDLGSSDSTKKTLRCTGPADEALVVEIDSSVAPRRFAASYSAGNAQPTRYKGTLGDGLESEWDFAIESRQNDKLGAESMIYREADASLTIYLSENRQIELACEAA